MYRGFNSRDGQSLPYPETLKSHPDVLPIACRLQDGSVV